MDEAIKGIISNIDINKSNSFYNNSRQPGGEPIAKNVD